MDYNKDLYNFIYGQIKNLKYAYNVDFNATDFKSLAENHYGFKPYPLDDWQIALEWAIADVFGGGCEVETI